MKSTIQLGHGSGGKLSHELVKSYFLDRFPNPAETKDTDAATLNVGSEQLGFTTDSYVVDPLFFPGGNIGNLAISGTVNDLLVSGYIPKYLSASFIIEEGFLMDDLETIVKTMVDEARMAGISIVTGDTKVVDKGKCDKLFINTSGIGVTYPALTLPLLPQNITPGDVIIINGSIGDHGMAVMAAREGLTSTGLRSDVAPLNKVIEPVLKYGKAVKFMRDATRGGLATVLNEVCSGQPFGVDIHEENILVNENVRGLCEILGFDPLYVANEGKVVMIVDADKADEILEKMRGVSQGSSAEIIGRIANEHPGMVVMETTIGGRRIVDMLTGQQLPRIC